jgi:diguanylate cyclase (GGDEF)-like protein
MSIRAAMEGTAQWQAAQLRTQRQGRIGATVCVLLIPGVMLGAQWLAAQLAVEPLRYLLQALFVLAVAAPVVAFVVRGIEQEQLHSDELISGIATELAEAATQADAESGRRREQARRQEFESRLANALDMAEGEPEVIDVIERSFASTLPGAPVELLLADNSQAHLLRMAGVSTTLGAPGCGVDSPHRCPAARRAQVQLFENSDDLDACPKLRGRPAGAVSAVCVPVSIMGRTVGVIHATGRPDTTFAHDKVQDLGTLAKLSGARIGLLRAMEETQLQAATDSLTGLLNRRSFEQEVANARRGNAPLTVAIADLDHFKQLNDTYGHDTGDRGLRLFAQVLAGSVRSQDIVGRHGGEEFVIALADCSLAGARVLLNGIRGRLATAIAVAGLPAFTASFGAVEAGALEDLPTLISRADQALFRAKRDGRDRVVVHDPAGRPIAPDPHHSRPTEGDLRFATQDLAEPSTVIAPDRASGQPVAR